MRGSITEIEVSEARSEHTEQVLTGDTGTLDPVDTINNKILLSKAIKDDSPEILAITEFKSMYNRKQNSFKKNSNFDFMLFQNQFDLIIKEIINQKIENDPDLKERILSQYKISLSDFANKKQDLESFYLSVINVFDLFDIKENLRSKLKNTGMVRVMLDTYGKTLIDHTSTLGFDFNEEYLESFLSSHSPDSFSGFDSSLSGNKFYRSLIQFVYSSYFGLTSAGQDYGGFYEENIEMSLTPSDSFSNFIQEIMIASRGTFTDFSSASSSRNIEPLQDLSTDTLSSRVTFEEFRAFGKSFLGDKLNLSPGGSDLINQSNLYSSSGQDIQVYNSIIDNNEPFFQSTGFGFEDASFVTGKDYFSKDLISRILENNSGDSGMLSHASGLLSKISKIKSFMINVYSDSGNSFFNGVIREVAIAAHSAFKISEIVTSDSDISSSPIDVLGSLVALNYLGEDPDIRVNNTGTGISISLGFQHGRSSTHDGLININLDEPTDDVALRYNYRPASRSEFVALLMNCKLTDDQFTREKSDNNQLKIRLAKKPGIEYLYAFDRFFAEIKNRNFFKNKYITENAAYKISLKILIYLFKDFRFRYSDGPIYNDAYSFINKKGLESLFVTRDLLEQKNAIETNEVLLLSDQMFGSERPKIKIAENRIKELYRQTGFSFFASFNIVNSLQNYYKNIISQVNSIGSKSLAISDLLGAEDFNLENIGAPTVEKLVNLNYGYKSIFCPTTSFNENMSYFPYKNTRTSNDLISINSFHKSNPLNLGIDENFEGMRIAAVGIPDGLINKLRLASGRSNNHTIIEISLLTLNHKYGNDGNTSKFTCRYKFLFNSCLHVNTINPDIDILSKASLDEFSFEDIVNTDSRSGFENFNLNEENLLSFNFGSIDNKSLSLATKKSFDDAIIYNNSTYKISSNTSFIGDPEYTFNNAMSGKIIKNHVINYILKKNMEIFAGTSLSESSFSYFDSSFINTPTQESASLVNYFNQQDYSDDLKDYLNRTSMTSPIINPDRFLIPAYGISSFERVFLLPCFKSRSKSAISDEELDYEEQFSFKSLIPVVRLL